MLEFRILGPFEVVDDERALGLGGPKQRALLAVLLLHRGEVVLSDRLIDEVWAGQPPATATKTLRVYVSNLRKALGDGVLATRGGGYLLAPGPGQVDLDCFERLAAEGRDLLDRGDARAARERLRSALALWRGSPLADFSYEPFAASEIVRLEEARLAALEDRIDADLALGGDGAVIPELESLVVSNPLQERLRGQLMRALYRAGRQADALAVYRQTRERLREELGLEPSRMLQDLERSILEQDPCLDAAGPPPGGSVAVCPFKGLAFFDRSDAEYFFGRERLVTELVAGLVESTLVGILGPSGIGKSSLLRAGLLPALSAGAIPSSTQWRQVLMRPGEHPCRTLERALAGDHLGDALERLPPGGRLVVAVDHLEELFTICRGEGERTALLDALIAAALDPERRALVLVTLRADFYGRFAAYPRFAELLSASHVLVSAMAPDELRRVIEQPAARAGLEVERPLVDALVSDVAGEPGGLPLLSTALLELWRARDGHLLRYENYRRSDGVRGAVARLAEAAYAQLGASERSVARKVMLRLASGDDAALARRRVPRAELERLDGARPVIAALSHARLLTVSDGEVELSHEALLHEWPRYAAWLEEDRIERRLHAHLMSSAREWDAAGRDDGDLYRGARLAGALEWAGQHSDELSPPEQRFLDASRHHAERSARRQGALLAGLGLLLLASLVAGTIALIEKQRATVAARVALARQLGAQAANEPRTDLAMLLAREAVNLDRSPATEGSLLALLERNSALVGSLGLPSDAPPQQLVVSPDGHILIVGASGLRFYDARAHSVSGRRRLTDLGGAGVPVYSAGGSLLAYPTSGNRSSIAVRDARTLRLRFRLDPPQRSDSSPDVPDAHLLITPDGKRIYAAYGAFSGADLARESTYLAGWSLQSGQLMSSTPIDGAGLLALGLSDAGARLVAVDARTIRSFDARSLRQLSSIAIKPASAAPTAAALSSDGRTIAIASHAGTVAFVDTQTGRAHTGAGPSMGPVRELVYSPNNRVVASAANSGVTIWNARSRTTVLTIPAGQVEPIAFSPDGQTLYTSSIGGLVLKWDMTGQASFGRQRAFNGQSTCCSNPVEPAGPPLALSPDGTTFAARLGASTVGLFSVRTMQRRGSFSVRSADVAAITALAWSPTAPELAVGGHSGVVQLWRTVGTPRLVRSLSGFQPANGRLEAIQAIQFSPDGRLIAASDVNQTSQPPGGSLASESPQRHGASLALWSTDTGKLSPGLYPRDLGTGPDPFDPLAFSPNSRLVAIAAPDGSDRVIDTLTAQTRAVLHPSGGQYTTSLAFSPTGTLATGTQNGIVQLWDPISRRRSAPPLLVTNGPISSIAFDSTGQRFVTTASQDGTIKLFATSTLQQEGAALNTDQGATPTAALAPRSNTLLVVNDRGNAFTWPLSLTAWEQRACAIAGRNLTRQEWNQFVAGQNYTRICP